MEISVEKYPRSLLGRNKKRFLSREREKLRSLAVYSIFDVRCPWGHEFHESGEVWWSGNLRVHERKCGITIPPRGMERSIVGERGREREKEGGSGQRRVPFSGSMCHSCVLSVTREIPRPRSLLELLNRGNRKGNPISREGGGRGPCAWIEDETTKGRESPPFGKYRFEERFSSNLIEAPNRLPFRFQFSGGVCIIEPSPSFSSSFFAFRTVFF